MTFDIMDKPLAGDAMRRDLLADAAGGVVIFEGLVRDHNEGKAVSALEYEIYEAMALTEAAKIFAEAEAKFDVVTMRGAHRSGRLEIGEMAIWVGVSAHHRGEAFKACRFLIDEIKNRLPVWKKEHYVEGAAEWVACQGCVHHDHPAPGAEQYYSRQLCLADFGPAGQQALQEARVLVVGAGGLGCPALTALAGAGVGQITICDGDRLDITNLHRQTLYDHTDLGELKAELAVRRLSALNPWIDLAACGTRLCTENVAELVTAHDVVLDCTDNFATRYLLHDTCFAAGKVLVQAGIYQYEGQLQVFDFRTPGTAGCLRCVWPDEPRADCVGTCTEVGVLGAVPAVLGSLQAMETIKLLTGRESPATSATVLVDLLTLEISRIARPRQPECPLCGEAPAASPTPSQESWEISLAKFRSRFPSGRIIDIREGWEREHIGGHDPTWEHMPLSDREELMSLDAVVETLLVCQHGVRTYRVAAELRGQGQAHIWSAVGGISVL